MKILVVGQTWPWPEITGARIRLANIIRGLARLGDIDLFAMSERPDLLEASHAAGAGSPQATGLPVARARVVARPRVEGTAGVRLRWLARSDLPLALYARNYGAVRSAVQQWAAGEYGLLWLSRAESFLALRSSASGPSIIAGPTIVDLDDLEDHKLAARVAPGRLARIQARRDVHLWHTLQARIARSVSRVVICSEVDRRRLEVLNAEIIPNGYSLRRPPVGRGAPGDPPTILFPGFLIYPPNLDAVRLLVGEILPRVRARLTAARLRLVGMANDEVRRFHRPPEIIVTGPVEDMADELAAADLVAVPLRFGGGTRIKILEAFAHRLPVVSTAKGAEGLDVVPDQHLIVADSWDAFAEGCIRALTDISLRAALVEAAHRLFLTQYRWEEIQDSIADLGASVAGERMSLE